MDLRNLFFSGKMAESRDQIARTVIRWGILILLLWAAVTVWLANDQSRADASEKAFMAIVPVVSAWVGTVLAFFFSSDAYSKSIDKLTDQKLASISVKEAMTPKSAMAYVSLEKGDDGSKVDLRTDLIDRLKPPVTRLPVLDHEGKAKYLIHQSVVYEFVTKRALEGPARPGTEAEQPAGEAGPPVPKEGEVRAALARLSLADLLAQPNMKEMISKSFAFVSEASTLADAKTKMESLEKCQDVFVTADGSPEKAVLGWLTNVQISRYAKL